MDYAGLENDDYAVNLLQVRPVASGGFKNPYGSKETNSRALGPKYHSDSSAWAVIPQFFESWDPQGTMVEVSGLLLVKDS